MLPSGLQDQPFISLDLHSSLGLGKGETDKIRTKGAGERAPASPELGSVFFCFVLFLQLTDLWNLGESH